MADSNTLMERVVEELSGNEALLQMLDTNAASEMLNWGIATARTMISKTRDRDGFDMELAILPRLKALRQSMRSIGNWAAGKYADPESQMELREKLLGHFRTIFGERRELPSARQLDEVLRQADNKSQTPKQLIVKLQDLLEQRG
jgi:hypothetical protein